MPDDKTTKVPETAAPDTEPGKPPEQAPVKKPVKTEPPTPEQKPPEQAADKAAPPKDKKAPSSEKAGAEKSPNVSVYNFSEIMAEKKAAEKEKRRRCTLLESISILKSGHSWYNRASDKFQFEEVK